jgi:hypothetical protein
MTVVEKAEPRAGGRSPVVLRAAVRLVETKLRAERLHPDRARRSAEAAAVEWAEHALTMARRPTAARAEIPFAPKAGSPRVPTNGTRPSIAVTRRSDFDDRVSTTEISITTRTRFASVSAAVVATGRVRALLVTRGLANVLRSAARSERFPAVPAMERAK